MNTTITKDNLLINGFDRRTECRQNVKNSEWYDQEYYTTESTELNAEIRVIITDKVTTTIETSSHNHDDHVTIPTSIITLEELLCLKKALTVSKETVKEYDSRL